MGRLQEFMDKAEQDENFAVPDDSARQSALMDQQKQTDLQRAQARSVARPIKKELRHSQIEGRYIRPEEVKKEIEKLEKAKQAEAERKKNIFSRIFGRIKKKQTVDEAKPASSPVNEPEKNATSDMPDAEKKKKAEQIRRLRGIATAKRSGKEDAEKRYLSVNGLNAADSFDEPEAGYDGFIPSEDGFATEPEERTSFLESFRRLNGNGAGFDGQSPDSQYVQYPPEESIPSVNLFAPVFSGEPDGVIATALSAAVGFVYWDEDGQKADRIITIRRLFSKQGDILIDAFCHDIEAPRLIAFSRGIRMYNLQTMKTYENPRDFLLHQVTGRADDTAPASGFAIALSVVRYELTALVYVAKSDFNRSDEENRLMLSYISQRCPTIDFDETEMLDYIAMLVPDEQSFSEALEIVAKQPQDIVLQFTRTFLQMMLSDGILHENERELLAELLFLLQSEGIDLSRVGLE